MPNPTLSLEDAQQTVAIVNEEIPKVFAANGHKRPRGNTLLHRAVGRRLGLAESSIKRRIDRCWELHGLAPDWSLWEQCEKNKPAPQPPPPLPNTPTAQVQPDIDMGPASSPPPPPTDSDISAYMRRARDGVTLEQIATHFKITPGTALDAISRLRVEEHHNIQLYGERYAYSKDIIPAIHQEQSEIHTYYSRDDNTYVFGACGDNHLGSKYERLDVLNELYDIYAAEGVDRVYNTGNWIDGEARFNRTDLHVHGMDNQCGYLAANYPKRPGIKTYAVSGDDHEGWYAQREAVNIGSYAEKKMHDAGRTDWVDLGYMECMIRLINSNTGAESMMAVVHPGGGSAYALSYSIQKIIEALDGGEKPAVGLYGHYHKLWAGNIRNVWCVQTGTTEDQTPFMRKKKIAAHVGGTLIRMHQDPESGAIMRFQPEMLRWFNKGFHAGNMQNRWTHSGTPQMLERQLGRE